MDRLDKAILLEKGAALLDERGWCQGAYESPIPGDTSLCMLGAVRFAAFGDVTFSNAITVGDADRKAAEDHYRWECEELGAVLGAVLAAQDGGEGDFPVASWNDTQCPGGHEAAETLRKMGAWYRRES